MPDLGALLLQNGIYAGAALLLVMLGAVLTAMLVLRLGNLFLGSGILGQAEPLQSAFARRVWRATLGFVLLTGLLLGAGLVLASLRGIHLADLVHRILDWARTRDLASLAVAALKTLGVLLLAFAAARLLVALLHGLRERLQRTDALVGHRQRVSELLEHLRLALTTTLLFTTLLFCADLLGLPGGARRVLAVLSYIAIALYVARFAVGAAYLAIDVIFDLSEMLSRLENPLRYLGRFRHLSGLTKRTADYFIYVGISTWTVDQITPGTWASQAGRLALRIIAIFYLSRVLVEVCVLFMNEYFLDGEGKTPAELQQRQTLVPVAAGLLRYSIYFTAVIMMLREAGIDPTPLLAGAGVAGVAVGLGAQAFVGDLVAGFFILFENLFLVGDFIQVGDVKGKVEEIGVRVTKIRDDAGILHAVPNGEVRKVSSQSKGYVNAVVDIAVPYGEDLHRIFDLLRQKTTELREGQKDILAPTEIAIESLKESAITVRTITMVKPGTAQEMEDILRLCIWDALTAARVTAPHARHLILSPQQAPDARPSGEHGVAERPRTDIQKIKGHNFYLGMDVDDNGYLEWADVDALGQRLLERQQRESGSPLHAELQRRLQGYWNEVVRLVDRGHDGRVSREEFLQFCAAVSRDPNGPAAASVQALADVLFTVCDRNGTDSLSEAEFVQFARAYGLVDAVATAGFNLIDRDRNGRITREEWLRFMRDVFLSKKLNDAAAVVFGPGCRDEA